MKEFNLAKLGNWMNSWVQPTGEIYGFHNHSVWGDNPMRWQDYTSGHSTFAAPYLVGVAMLLQKKYDQRACDLLEKMVAYQASSMREDGEYLHIGFQAGELAKVGLIHNMVPAVSLELAVLYAGEYLTEETRKAAFESVKTVLEQGSMHYQNGRSGRQGCCNQDYTRIWAKLLFQKVFDDYRFEQEVKEDLDYMVENFHISGVPDAESDGTLRALEGSDQFLLEPAEYYGLMISPLCLAYEMFKNENWLEAAKRLCRHVVRSSFIDDRNYRRVHRAYYSLEQGGWGKLTQPMQVQGNGMTLYSIQYCFELTQDSEFEAFLNDMNQTMIGYQTERGFVCAATGWDCEADAIPATAWQAHDFMYFAYLQENVTEEFWDVMFSEVDECSVVLANNCVWIEDGSLWTIQDYFSRCVYNVLGRKDRNMFGRDLAWTGEKNVVDETYYWKAMPRFVQKDGVIKPLRTLSQRVKVYNFSNYTYISKAD